MKTREAALSVGVTVALGATLFGAPLWAVITGGAAGALLVKKILDA